MFGALAPLNEMTMPSVPPPLGKQAAGQLF
jgi:hypothetical protein